ncbi:hypothetical protein AB0J38_11595 [Streptomyces sp. NPDC050095]|uniref:MinD/ParA family ATP-binding protein n=1 Tax=unclassified Streptomyces TaxID=2593676 RepID=UPI003441FF40
MRRLIVLGSVTGAPGVTTTALAVAAAWAPQADGGVRPVMVEAGVWGGELTTRCGVPHTPGLLDVASAVRQPQPGSLLGAASELPFGARAVVAPSGRRACTEAVRMLASPTGRRVLLGDDHDQGAVLLDVGRINEDVEPLLDCADDVVLVTRGAPEALTHVYAHGLDDHTVKDALLAVVGPCAYAAPEIAETLGMERVVSLPWDVRTVGLMRSRRRIVLRTSGFRTPPLMTAARGLALQLSGSASATDKKQARTATPSDDLPAMVGRVHTGLTELPDGEGK